MAYLRFPIFSLYLLLATGLGISSSATAQEPPPGGNQPEAAAPAVEDNAASATPIREQTIYIPYKRLREVFEQQGRGVFLPYEKFQELWQKARASDMPRPDNQPPVGALISEIDNEATIERDVLTVQATLRIELLGKGWHALPLRLNDSAIRSATLGDEPARVIYQPDQGYQLLIKNDDDAPRQLTLNLVYTKAFSKSPGQNSVSFEAPVAPINRWRIRVPQAGVKVNVQPLIAATEAPAADPAAPVDETVVLAFVGAAPTVSINWTPKSEGAAGLEALATVQAQQEVVVEEGVIRTRTRLTYEISRSELNQLVVEVPADQKVTRVLDANVRKWDITAEADKQTITIDLFQPARGTQELTLELERFSDEQALRDVLVPVVKAVGVGRQQGIVVARLGEELRGEPTVKNGLLQLDAAELPPGLQNTPWSFSYRYAAIPFEFRLNVEKVQPVLQARQLVEAYLEPRALTIDLVGQIDVQKAGVYQFQVAIPDGFEIRSVVGHSIAGCTAATIDKYRVTGEMPRVLQIDLAQKALGKTGFLVELHRTLEDANLLEPTGATSAITVPIPKVLVANDQLSGGVVIHAPESLRLVPVASDVLRAVSFVEARQEIESLRQGRFPDAREVLAFAHAAQVADPQLTVERRRPYVTAQQLLQVHIDSGVTKYEVQFFFEVQYSGVKTLRIDVPTDLADQIRNRTPQFRESTMNPQPADVAAGYTAWRFEGEREFLGSSTIVLGWEQQGDELQVGKSTTLEIPELRPRGTDRAWGQIVLTKSETLDIQADKVEGVRPIDPREELDPRAAAAEAARAFEFHDVWSLSVVATRYELEEVKRTSIERAFVRMVVTRGEKIAVQAIYRIRSAVQRLAVELPANYTFDRDPLYINGELASIERGDQGRLYVPLVNQKPDEPFVVELRYELPGNQRQLDLPYFPSQEGQQTEPAVQQVQLAVYLPEDLALLGTRGPWTNHQARWYRHLNRLDLNQPDDNAQIASVFAGVPVNNQRAGEFPVDGRRYTFTTLRPEPPPAGSLRLIAWDQRVLNLTLYLSLFVVGVVCIRQAPRTKLVLLMLIVLGLVAVGVFAPTFAMQIMDQYLAIAIMSLVVVWGVASAVWHRTPPPPPPPTPAPPPTAVPPPPASTTPATGSREVQIEDVDGESPFRGENQPPTSADDRGEDTGKGGPSNA